MCRFFVGFALHFKVNGGVCVSDNEDWRDGFLWFTEWDGVYEGQIITLTAFDIYGEIARYMKNRVVQTELLCFFLPFN